MGHGSEPWIFVNEEYLRHGSTLNSHRAASSLVRLEEGEERRKNLGPCRVEFRGSCSDVTVDQGCISPVVKVSGHGRYVMSSSPVPLKTRRVGVRCMLNLSRAQTTFPWCGVVVRREGRQLMCRPRPLVMVQNYEFRRRKPSYRGTERVRR
ncbi:uncharacterized protein TNCV_4259031 [Trichonephila clavipes]|nr:uncharacterized protein TNCV_4259031 [Trichonephila clavipes]